METESDRELRKGIIRCVWCVDSNDGRQLLINLRTNEIISERKDGRIIDPGQVGGMDEKK